MMVRMNFGHPDAGNCCPAPPGLASAKLNPMNSAITPAPAPAIPVCQSESARMDQVFDVIVVGGGHAGVEAAWAASHILAGCGQVAMITMDRHAIGRMSCNPAIGGLAKGQIVREIDALGGLMGHAIDASGIQFRILNKSKGPAVQSPRAQADKYRYALAVQCLLATHCPNLTIIEGIVDELLAEPSPHGGGNTLPIVNSGSPSATANQWTIRGVKLESGMNLIGGSVILTTGTFLRGLMHTGEHQTVGGRVGEKSAVGLSASLARLGIELGRLKTGTPPRLARDSIDFSALVPQAGDSPPVPFSYLSGTEASPLAAQFPPLPQVNCFITYTNPQVHDLIRGNLHRAPMYSGQIQGRGPRYCPSIEDKVVRFADKSQHQIFLEPESLDTDEIYCNGISTSLPMDVQERIVHSIVGLEKARILKWGYAVEYDFAPTHQIDATLQTHAVTGLFLAGQINGTSGYEEAAGQGLMAGINAARSARDQPACVLSRHQAYIGVMIDDLITKVPTEPYRMFTSRAEFRLSLRSDNADQRLTDIGYSLGLAQPNRVRLLTQKREQMAVLTRSLRHASIVGGTTAYELLSRPEVEPAALAAMEFVRGREIIPLLLDPANASAIEQVRIEARYRGYIDREEQAVQRLADLDEKTIPRGFDAARVVELRREARDALLKFRPQTLGQASRLEGITPADLTILLMHISNPRRREQKADA